MIASLHRCRVLLIVLACASTPGPAQTIPFEIRTHPDSPITFVNDKSSPWRSGVDRRIFVNIQNKSDKPVIAVTFEQTISTKAKTEIVSLERISIIISPREKKRLSVSVSEVLNRFKAAGDSDDKPGNPVLSVVAVEFLDGTLWDAP
ncbi:MAG TPA: hypothetical protein VGH38_22130 [Bryobacteraceae bacterium]